jgi:hypothetical protein
MAIQVIKSTVQIYMAFICVVKRQNVVYTKAQLRFNG